MSQQKVLLCVCIIAAFSAIASADVTAQSCIQDLQDAARTYGQQLQTAAMNYAKAMSSSASFDQNGFLTDVNKVVGEYMSLANMNTTMDPSKLYDQLSGLMAGQIKIFRKYMMNTEITMGAMNAASKLLTDLMLANTSYMGSISSGCIPGSS